MTISYLLSLSLHELFVDNECEWGVFLSNPLSVKKKLDLLPERRNVFFFLQSLHTYLYIQLKAKFYKLAPAFVSWDNEMFY